METELTVEELDFQLEKENLKKRIKTEEVVETEFKYNEKNPYNFNFDGPLHVNVAYKPAIKKYLIWKYPPETIGAIIGCSGQMVTKAIEDWGLREEIKNDKITQKKKKAKTVKTLESKK